MLSSIVLCVVPGLFSISLLDLFLHLFLFLWIRLMSWFTSFVWLPWNAFSWLLSYGHFCSVDRLICLSASFRGMLFVVAAWNFNAVRASYAITGYILQGVVSSKFIFSQHRSFPHIPSLWPSQRPRAVHSSDRSLYVLAAIEVGISCLRICTTWLEICPFRISGNTFNGKLDMCNSTAVSKQQSLSESSCGSCPFFGSEVFCDEVRVAFVHL